MRRIRVKGEGTPEWIASKLPLCLWTALARAYRDAPWIAVFQPPLGDQAVVVASRNESAPIGGLVISEV